MVSDTTKKRLIGTFIAWRSIWLWALVWAVPCVGASVDPPDRDSPPEPQARFHRAPPGSRMGPGDKRPFGRRPRRPEFDLWKRLSETEREGVRAFAQEHFPRMYEQLQRAEERNPVRFRRRMRKILPHLLELMDIMETDPDRGALMIQERRLDIRIRQAASRYRSADGEAQRSRLSKKLRESCAELFDCRQRRRALEILRLEARINELNDRHEEAEGMREQLIDRIFKEYVGGGPGDRPKRIGRD